MYKLFITLRYLRTRVISYVAAFVLALGVAVLIIVTSVMGGFQGEFHKKIRGMLADVSVDSQFGSYSIDAPENLIREVLEDPRVAAAAPYVATIALLDTQLRKDYGFLTGIDPAREVKVSELGVYMRSRVEVFDLEVQDLPKEERESAFYKASRADLPDDRPDPVKLLEGPTRSGHPPVLAGAQLYRALQLRLPGQDAKGRAHPGDVITLVTTSEKTFQETGQVRDEDARKGKFEVVGVFETGMFDQDRRHLIAPLGAVQEFMNIGGSVSGINIKLRDFREAKAAAEALQSKLSRRHPVRATPWNERNKTLMEAVQIEKFLVYFVIVFMMLLAGLCLSAIMTMSVIEKTKDLGILGAVGATRWGRFAIFLWQGGLIGIAGSVLGVALGFAFVYNVNWIDRNVMTKLIGKRVFDPSVYYLDKIPTEVDLQTLAVCVVPTVLIGFVLSLYPAFRAARLDPIEALRHE